MRQRRREKTVIELWDVEHRPPEHLAQLKAPYFVRSGAPDGRFLAFLTNGTVTLLDIGSREGVARPTVVPGADGFALSRDGSRLAILAEGTKRRMVVLWDVARLVTSGP